MKKSILKFLATSMSIVLTAGMFPVASLAAVENGWEETDGKYYWYENGVRQGYDADNPYYRGKEIYDPGSDAWYWLDNVDGGTTAVDKGVYEDPRSGPRREGTVDG